MDNIQLALELSKRQVELESGLSKSGGFRVTSEHNLYALGEHLQRYPEAVNATFQAATTLRRPVDSMSAERLRGLAS